MNDDFPVPTIGDISGRATDRNQDVEEGVERQSRERGGTLIVLIAFAVSLAGAAGFVWTYWYDAGNLQLLGVSLCAFLGCLGAGLVFYAHWLTVHKEAMEPRETLPSPQDERDQAYAACSSGKHDVQRRNVLVWMLTGVFAGAAAIVVSLFRSIGTPPGPELSDAIWKRGQKLVTVDNNPMMVDSLHVGDTAIVFPEDQIGSEHAQTVLIRVDEKSLQLPRDRSDWAPQGYVAYSRVCTHAGCAVGLYEKTVCQLLCPCHQSTFDVLKACQVTGGPADRPLPQLPLYADADGTLRAGGGFTSPPGPGFWGMPTE